MILTQNPTHPAFGHPLCFGANPESNLSKEGKETNTLNFLAPDHTHTQPNNRSRPRRSPQPVVTDCCHNIGKPTRSLAGLQTSFGSLLASRSRILCYSERSQPRAEYAYLSSFPFGRTVLTLFPAACYFLNDQKVTKKSPTPMVSDFL